MPKVLVVGIDGMDPELVELYASDLPNLTSIGPDGEVGRLVSTFPPDSIPAWCSIFTGTDPSVHGVFGHVDYLGGAAKAEISGAEALAGRTFWDAAGEAGVSVCVVNPFVAYPAWDVNGWMLSGAMSSGDNPSVTVAEGDGPSGDTSALGGIAAFPKAQELPAFVAETREHALRLEALALDSFRRSDADLCFVCFFELDRIQHFLWRYCDPDDPTCPGPNPLEYTIRDFYLLFDEILGRLREWAGPETALVVLSDHGHGRRCTSVFNVNEVLRRAGLYVAEGSGSSADWRRVLERAKGAVMRAADRMDAVDLLYRAARLVPGRKALKSGSYLVDRSRSLAVASDIGGTNPFGGVDIRDDVVAASGLDREEVVARVVTLLSEYAVTGSGARVCKWVRRREELFEGPHAAKYPDVLFELRPDSGVGTSVHGDVLEVNATHRKISGGHRREGCLLFEGATSEPVPAEGVHDIILGLAGVAAPARTRRGTGEGA